LAPLGSVTDGSGEAPLDVGFANLGGLAAASFPFVREGEWVEVKQDAR